MAHVTVKLPENHPITVSPVVYAGSTQLIRIHYTPLGVPPPNTRMSEWTGKGEGVALESRVLTTGAGDFTIETWHWNNEVEEWEFNTTRTERPMDGIGTNTPGVR